jgi:hypothetical protein
MARRRAIEYPFVPKSTASLVAGQLWAIPLSNGRFACGRVLQAVRERSVGSRTMFLAGLMNWCGAAPPTSESIAGSGVVAEGGAHIVTIVDNGGAITGMRPLDLDGIEPALRLDAHEGARLMVVRGLVPLRVATREDRLALSVQTWWGRAAIARRAERLFVESGVAG